MADAPNPDGLIARRLEHLFRAVHPVARGPYTPGDVAAAINAEAGEDVISGRRDNPTYKHLIAISRFFGVSTMYFFEESETDRGAIPAEVAAVLQDDAVRDLALRAATVDHVADRLERVLRQAYLVASVIDGGPGGYVAFHVYARYASALEDRPIPITFAVSGADLTPGGAEAVEAMLRYGVIRVAAHAGRRTSTSSSSSPIRASRSARNGVRPFRAGERADADAGLSSRGLAGPARSVHGG